MLRSPPLAVRRRLGRRWLAVAPALAGCLVAALPVAASCPGEAAVHRRLEELGAVASRDGAEGPAAVPDELVRRAARSPGEPVVDRHGKTGYGAELVAQPVSVLWKALNDEDHHALDGRYLPVEHSEVIGGTPRGESRLLFQYFDRWGIGRWWVSRVEMDGDLYRRSGGALWRLSWHDAMDSVDPSRPPVASAASRLAPIQGSRGSWLLVPLGDRCTLVEYFTWSDPGGWLGAFQGLAARRALRETLEGIVRLAAEHIGKPHPDAHFVRPDGSALP